MNTTLITAILTALPPLLIAILAFWHSISTATQLKALEKTRMFQRAVDVQQQGMAPDAARTLAKQALNTPPKVHIPTIEELDEAP